MCSITVYFYESCSILASPKGEWNWPWLLRLQDCWFTHKRLFYKTLTVLRDIVGLALFLPGQGPSLHGLFLTGSPVHCLPPALGAGLLHCLLLMLVPGPHDTLHALQSLQAPQPPSTAKGTENRSVQSLKEYYEKEISSFLDETCVAWSRFWYQTLHDIWYHALCENLNLDLPGQFCVLQWRFSSFEPGQFPRPTHVRLRFCVPVPQVLVHADHGPQEPQLP